MKPSRPKITAVILAAGNGQRLQGEACLKQLMAINGRPLVNYCLDIYQKLDAVDAITLVANNSYLHTFEEIVKENNYTKVTDIVAGGPLRQDSIFNALSVLQPCDYVIIQNAVSIFTAPELIEECIQKAIRHEAVTAFFHEIYSSFLLEQHEIKKVIDRDCLGHIRDPQVFRFALLIDIHKRMHREKKGPFTNDVLMLKEYGYNTYLVESPPENFKITNNFDFQVAIKILQGTE